MSRAVVFISVLSLSAAAGLVGGRRAAAELAPPRNVGAEPGTPQSNTLTSRAASAEIMGRAQEALRLADQALAADPRNPWARYDRASALSRLGVTDEAVQTFRTAEQQFSPSDRWARSVAIYGRAHALAEAQRCAEAEAAFTEYAAYVAKDDPQSAEMARRYAATCRPPVVPPAPPAPTSQPEGEEPEGDS